MATALQFRRGTTAQHALFTGLAGEVTVDTDKGVAVVHDGLTAGGLPLVGSNEHSQVLSELLGTIAYALDVAYANAPRNFAESVAPDQLGYFQTYLNDLVGVVAKAISGGEVILGQGSVALPAVSFLGDRNTGVYSPAADQLAIATGGVQRLLVDASGNHATGTDNAQSLGTASKRWSTVYAGTGTINTSDAREKTLVAALTPSEIAAASDLSKMVGTYQFIESIEAKGDAARHHIGLTVQDAIAVMESHGLNPFRYGFICHDAWTEITVEHPAIEAVEDELDEDGNMIRPGRPAVEAWTEVVQEAGDRYAFRYDQLSLFISAGLHARMAALETA